MLKNQIHFEQYFESIGFKKEVILNTSNRRGEISQSLVLINEEKEILIQLNAIDNLKDESLFNFKIIFSLKNGDLDKQLDLKIVQDIITAFNAICVHRYYHSAHSNYCNLFVIDKTQINWDYMYTILEEEFKNAD